MYRDAFINNVSRYVTVSRYVWNVPVTYLDTFEMYRPKVCLELSFEIKEKTLTWIKYLTDRKQCVSMAEKTSPDVYLSGGPQGSVLRPENYCMYTKPVGEMPMLHNCT